MLKEKAIRAVGWTVVEQIALQGGTFILSIVLARLFSPSEFGTVALLGIFMGVSRVFIDGGLSTALVQKRECTQEDLSTVFWFNLAMATILSLAVFLAAPLIAAYLDKPVLEPIARCLAPLLAISATTSVHYSIFLRNMDVKTPLKINLLNLLAGGATAVLMGLAGYGVWALVGQSIVSSLCYAVQTWAASPWRPSPVFSRNSFRTLFGFGGFMFLSSLLYVVYQQLASLLIGKRYGAHDLGIYNRGDTTTRMVSTLISNLAGRFAFPLFSQIHDDRERLRKVVRIAVRGIMFLNIPAMLGLCAVAKPLVKTFYGAAWLPAVPFLSIFAVGSLLLPLHFLNLDILKALGQSGKFFKIELIKRAISISLIVGGAFFGIYGLAWSTVIASFAVFAINAHYTAKAIRYGAWEQLRDCGPAALCGLIMMGGVMLVEPWLHLPAPAALAALCLLGVVLFVASAFLFRVPELWQAIGMAKSLLARVIPSPKGSAPGRVNLDGQ